jgi:uncharacterized membrane-anchored protein
MAARTATPATAQGAAAPAQTFQAAAPANAIGFSVQSLLDQATALGVQLSPYEEKAVLAQNVEGIVEPSQFGHVLVISDSTGTARITIGSSAYVAGKTSYDIVLVEAIRDFKTTTVTIEKGTKRMRAV